MSEFGWTDFIRRNQQLRLEVRKAFALTAERLEKIKEYKLTKRIKYPEHQKAFDYVHSIYPSAAIKQANIYHCPQYYLKEVGYSGIGGFYDTNAKVVVITDCVEDGIYNEFKVSGEMTPDEVLCHELIHYGANYKLAVASRAVEEEIAYGKSIPYLRSNGRTDDFIIEKNMLPYLMSVIDKSEVYRKVLLRHFDADMLAKASIETIELLLPPLHSEIFRESKKAAIKIGKQMVSAYGGGEVQAIVSTKRKLILDDDMEI